MTDFTAFGLAEPLVTAVADAGYDSPTPIQVQAIPPALQGHDLLGIAQTGTGKTAAFALPILNHLHHNPAPRRKLAARTLILAPTRELAIQIADSFRTYARYLKLSIQTVFGGVPVTRNERMLANGVDVLVATPGRLLDLVDRRSLLLDQVEILVLDEADQMLDLGFIHDLRRIARLLPRQRQSLFFSATMPPAIAELAGNFLANPVKVEVAPVATTAERVEQFVTFVNQAEKQALLTLTLRKPDFAKCIVFTRTKHGADRVVRHLLGADIPAAAIHGNKSQPQRERALDQFRRGEIGVLVATDIAARGIDIDAVSHVINFELPNVPEQYVHRIGRTARAGKDGVALSFCAPDEKPYLRDIEKLTRQKVSALPLPPNFVAEAARLPKPAPAPRGGRGRDRDAREGYAHRSEVGTHAHALRPAKGPQGARASRGGAKTSRPAATGGNSGGMSADGTRHNGVRNNGPASGKPQRGRRPGQRGNHRPAQHD